jgi:hypothetical protein
MKCLTFYETTMTPICKKITKRFSLFISSMEEDLLLIPEA